MKKGKKNFTPVPEPTGINVQQLRVAISNNKKWFIICGVLGLLAALTYNYLVHQKYNVSTTVLVKPDNTQGTLNTLYKDLGVPKNINVQNQVGVLSSFTLNLQALQNLKWNTSWQLDRFLSPVDLYKNDPYQVVTAPGSVQVKDVPLHIKPVGANQYKVEADEVQEIDGIKRNIKFEQTGTFGQPFKNQYFNFTLNKIPNRITEADDKFVLTFNDLLLMAKEYQEKLKIKTSDAESNLIYVSLDTRQLNRAVDYLNELGRDYVQFGLMEKNRLAKNTVDFINKQISGVSDSLQHAGNNVTNYRASNDVVDIDQQSTSAITNLDKLNGDESQARMKVEYFSSLKRYLNNAGAMKSMVAPSVAGVTDPSLNANIIQLSDLYRQREVLAATAQEKSPQLITLNNQIAYTQRSLTESINSLLSNAQQELSGISQQRQSVAATRASLPKKEQSLNSIKRSFDLNNELYTFLLQKRSEAQIAQASHDPDAQVLDQASFGTANLMGFNHVVNLILGLILGLAIPLAVITGKTFFNRNLEQVTDVTSQLRPSVIGNIYHNKFDDELPVLSYPHSEITESFRGLRINIHYLLQSLESKVIAIHSSISGEGKTFVSANLAATLAMSGKTVLLIDADMRKPRTHILYHVGNEVGLSNYLEGRSSYDQIITPTQVNRLSLVCAGPKPLNPSELLTNNKIERLIAEAKQHYEFIIINNPPLNIVNDAMMVVPFADMNLFLLRMKSSTRAELMYINKIAQEGIIKNIAIALNNVTSESFGLYGKNTGEYYSDTRLLTT